MEPHDAIDLGRDAIQACLFVGGPILLIGMIVGLLIGAVQSMTGIHDQTVSFVPKVLLMVVAIAFALPWLSERLVDYTRQSISKPVMTMTTESPIDYFE